MSTKDRLFCAILLRHQILLTGYILLANLSSVILSFGNLKCKIIVFRICKLRKVNKKQRVKSKRKKSKKNLLKDMQDEKQE